MNAIAQAAKSMVQPDSTTTHRPAMVYPLYAVMSMRLAAYLTRCETEPNSDWAHKHRERMEELVKNGLPSGSGFDSGTTFELSESTPEKLVFKTAFHHMSEHGYYDGWTYHTVVVRPSLAHQFNLTVSGRNKNDIVDFIHEAFNRMLRVEVSY